MERLKQQLTKAGQQHLSREEILQILEERTHAAQHELAAQSDAGSDVLGYLARHGGVATRRAVAANSAAPPNVNRFCAKTKTTMCAPSWRARSPG